MFGDTFVSGSLLLFLVLFNSLCCLVGCVVLSCVAGLGGALASTCGVWGCMSLPFERPGLLATSVYNFQTRCFWPDLRMQK